MAIDCTERYFDSQCGEARVRYLTWKNSNNKKPVGIYLLAHGIGEHIDRYDEFARFLADKGFVVYGEDHLGHGKTAATKADIGLTPKDGDFYIVEDMHVLQNIATTEYPDLPVFLLGHSMGSFIAKVYTCKYGDELKAAVYCGSGHFPAFLKLLKAPVKALLNIAPNVRFNMPANMVVNWWLSVDRGNRREYLKDELNASVYSLALIRDAAMLGVDSCVNGWNKNLRKDLPILIISGSMDPVGLFGIGVNAMERSLKREGQKDVKKILYRPYRHEILRERGCKNKVYDDVYAWTKKHM